jgi:hypothetical protein
LYVLGSNGYIWVNYKKLKKLLYLLLAITFIGCSSDNNSSSNSSNNSVYTVKYEVTTDAPTEGFSQFIRYTNSTGNDNVFETNELFWEQEIQIDSEDGSYVLLDADANTNECLINAKIYVNGELKGESTVVASNAYVIYYFPFQP